MLKNYSQLLDRKINKLEDEVKLNMNDNKRYNKGFKPSRTAQNSLNFITQEDENNLLNITPTDDVCDIVKIINILIRNSEVVPKDQMMSNLLTQTLPRLSLNSLSKILLLRIAFYKGYLS